MPKRSWNDIKARFAGHWVELVECDWKNGAAHPARAIVRRASVERSQLLSALKKESAQKKEAGQKKDSGLEVTQADGADSVVVFVSPYMASHPVRHSQNMFDDRLAVRGVS